MRALYIAKVRKDEDGPWEYVDETNCATEKQCHARRFRDRKIAKELALEYECEYKIVRLIPRGWKGGQVVLTKEDESAAYAFSGEDGIELDEYDVVILGAHFARYRIALAQRLESGLAKAAKHLSEASNRMLGAVCPCPCCPPFEPNVGELQEAADAVDELLRARMTPAEAKADAMRHGRPFPIETSSAERSALVAPSAVTPTVSEMEAYLLLAKEDRKRRIAAHMAKAAREEARYKKALTAAQRSITRWKNRAAARKVALSCIADAIADVKTAQAETFQVRPPTADPPPYRIAYKYADGTGYTTLSAWMDQGTAHIHACHALSLTAGKEEHRRIVDFEIVGGPPQAPKQPQYRVVYTYANGTTYTTSATWRDEKGAAAVGKKALAMSAKDDDPTYRIVNFFAIESAAEPGWVRPDPAAGVIAWERNKDLTGGAR